MGWLGIGIPLLVIAVYLVVSIRILRPVLAGGGGLGSRIQAIASLGPGEVLRQTWKSALMLVGGLIVLIVAVASYNSYLAYEAAPRCGLVAGHDCRAVAELRVTGVDTQSTKSGQETIVSFGDGYGSATFRSDDVPPQSVERGTTVIGEVWRGDVTALVIGGIKHQSFATQSDAWIGIAAGLGLVLLSLSWIGIDLALDSIEATVGAIRQAFASPVKRRHALYVLLPLFGALLVVFGFAYVAVAVRAFDMANTLAGIYLVGAFLTLPPLVLVFVAWLSRAYMNVRALGLRTKHSSWFVAAATFLPPLSLYMPYRLMHEMVAQTNAPVSTRVLRNWWACAIGWLGLTVIGLSIGSPDPRDTSLSNELSNAMLIGSVLVGLFGVWLTIRLVHAIDTTESALAAHSQA